MGPPSLAEHQLSGTAGSWRSPPLGGRSPVSSPHRRHRSGVGTAAIVGIERQIEGGAGLAAELRS